MTKYTCRLVDGQTIEVSETNYKNAAIGALRKVGGISGSINLVEATVNDAEIEVVGPRTRKYYKRKQGSRPAKQTGRVLSVTALCTQFNSLEDVWNLFGRPTSKGLTVNQLYALLQLQIKAGRGNKHIAVSVDDECNGFHSLWEGLMGDSTEIAKWFSVCPDHDGRDPSEVILLF